MNVNTGSRHPLVSVALSISLLSVGGSLGSSPDHARATWVEIETVRQTLTAGMVAIPANFHCTDGLLSPVTFSWSAPVGGVRITGYRWNLTTIDGHPVSSGTLSAATTSQSVSPGGLVGSGSTYNFSLVALGPSPWESMVVSGTARFTSVAFVGLSSACSPH